MLNIPYETIFKDIVNIEGREINGQELKWSVFRDYPAEKMYDVVGNYVFPFIKTLDGNKESAYSKYMGDAIFKVPTLVNA